MEERYNLYSQGRNGWTAFRNQEEYQEEDVWAVFGERNDHNPKIGSYESPAITTRWVPTAARMIPRGNNNSAKELKLNPQSAPVAIPDWSKIYGMSSKKISRNVSFHGDGVKGRCNLGIKDSWDIDEDDDDGVFDVEIIPPHEWLAKKLARTQISSFSVCEGAGRTLKGRDLSRVRNAVLTRTGFLE